MENQMLKNKNGVDYLIIAERYGVSLLKTTNQTVPMFAIAIDFDFDTGTWAKGIYFTNDRYEDAHDCFVLTKLKQRNMIARNQVVAYFGNDIEDDLMDRYWDEGNFAIKEGIDGIGYVYFTNFPLSSSDIDWAIDLSSNALIHDKAILSCLFKY